MTNDTDLQQADNQQIRRGRLQLAAILGIVAVPVLVSYFMFYTGIGVPTDTVNKGVLIEPPVAIGAARLSDDAGQDWSLAEQGPVFKLLQFVGGDCAENCRTLLYNARQVHTRLGKEASQVLRLAVHTGNLSQATRELLARDYPKAVVLSGDYPQWQALLPDGDPSNTERLYVVDRRGFLVMYYTPNHSGGELLKDLNRLVKTVQ